MNANPFSIQADGVQTDLSLQPPRNVIMSREDGSSFSLGSGWSGAEAGRIQRQVS